MQSMRRMACDPAGPRDTLPPMATHALPIIGPSHGRRRRIVVNIRNPNASAALPALLVPADAKPEAKQALLAAYAVYQTAARTYAAEVGR